jgi:superfamily I DNA and/or RNA helicase
LTAYVQHAVQKGQRVLVTAHSNAAVDNLLVGDSTTEEPEEGTLHQLAQADGSDLKIKRVGDHSSNDVVLENYCTNHNQMRGRQRNVIAATTSGASDFSTDEFDVAVVDEATQADKASTSIVLNCAQKLVLAGDHKQLPPYSATDNEDDRETVISLFEYLLDRYGRNLPILLRKQYRMNDVIAQFPNKAFYDGKLETAEQNRDWQIGRLSPLAGVHTTGGEQQSAGTHSYQNQNEAEIVAEEVEYLINESNLSPENIGIISGYNAQIGMIKKRLKKLNDVPTNDITVDTVDSFQGGEREVIIVSFVRSNSRNNSGFLEELGVGERRLNVAITRARKRLVLIGDWDTLGTIADHRGAETSCAPVYAKLEDYIRSLETMSSVPTSQ